MREGGMRKYHGTIGVIMSLFILVQVGSGTLIAFDKVLGPGGHVPAEPSQHSAKDKVDSHDEQNYRDNFIQVLRVIHHHGEGSVQALRVLLGLGVIFMVVSGISIYVLARKRKKQVPNKEF